MKTIIPILIISLLLLTGCPSDPPVIPADDVGATQEGISQAVNANNQFAFEMYKQLEGKEEGNIFFSPYSLTAAMSMVYEGAEGTTKEEMQNVMHYSDADDRQPSFAKIQNNINKQDKDYKLYTANALWIQNGFNLLDSYTGTIERYYSGTSENVDFSGDAQGSADKINDWVSLYTNKKIPTIVKPEMLPQMKLVLTNAIYFKGDWVHEFKKSNTKERDFYKSDGSTIKVDMMNQKEGFKYGETELFQFLEMPYKGEEISMFIILPEKGTKVNYKELFTAENLNEWRNNMRKTEVQVYLPKFKFETEYSMAEDFKKLGMPTAFTGAADFSGITGGKDLMIDFVIHKAYVDVNEEGTEAAAATAIGMRLTSAGPMHQTFNADHPFIFVIQDTETGLILFMGEVEDPTVE